MTKKVNVTYTDNISLTDSEIVKSNKQLYGENTIVTITPIDNKPTTHIYFGIKELITEEQVRLFFDEGQYRYKDSMPLLRQKILTEVEQILNQVIIDNEDQIV